MAETSMFGFWDYPNLFGFSITSWLLIFMLLFVVLSLVYTAIARSCKGKGAGICDKKTLPLIRLVFLIPTMAVNLLLGITAFYVLYTDLLWGGIRLV